MPWGHRRGQSDELPGKVFGAGDASRVDVRSGHQNRRLKAGLKPCPFQNAREVEFSKTGSGVPLNTPNGEFVESSNPSDGRGPCRQKFLN